MLGAGFEEGIDCRTFGMFLRRRSGRNFLSWRSLWMKLLRIRGEQGRRDRGSSMRIGRLLRLIDVIPWKI